MSSCDSPQMEDGGSDLAQSSLLGRILENQEAIHGLSEKLMPLLMGNLQRMAEANRQEYDPPADTETNNDIPRDPRNRPSGRKEPAAQHVAGSGEPDLRLRDGDDSGNAAQSNPGEAALNNPAYNTQGNAAQISQDNAAHICQGSAAHYWQGNAAQNYWDSLPPWSGVPPWGHWYFPFPPPPPPSQSSFPHASRNGEAPGSSSSPGPSGGDEDSITPFISESERGELASSEDNDGSGVEDDGSAPPAKRPKLGKEVTGLLRQATEKPLEQEKQKKLTAHFPLPASDATHPPKPDKDISALVPKSAATYDRLLSKIQQFNMDSLGPLLSALQQVKKGKCTARDLVAPLETAIKLSGNAAAHLSMERRRALLRHLNSDLKSLAEDEFSDRGPLLFGKDFASKAKSTADNVKALKGFIPKKNLKGFSGSGDQHKRKSFQPQGRRQFWGTQRQAFGQRFSVFNRLAPPLRQNPPVPKHIQQTKK